MKLFGKSALAILCLFSAMAAQAAVTASIDRGNLSIGDAFEFTLTATAGEDLGNTNFSALTKDFEVRSSSRESSFSYGGGKQSASSKLRIVLAAKRTGRLTIPALNVDGVKTSPITIMVREGRADLNAVDELFVEAEVSSKTVYTQEQFLYTFRLYRSVALRDADYDWASMDNASVEQLEGASYSKRIDGVDYQVSELRFVIYPQQAGTLEIPPITFVGQVGRNMFERGPTLRRKTEAIRVKVLPIPAEYPGAAWIPTTKLEISESWSADPASLGVGDSSTRTITLRANGLPGTQLPPLPTPELDGIKIYPDQPKTENITTRNGINALGINSAAWVVVRDGDYQIPEVRVPWWDTVAKKVRYATLPARTLSVAPAATTAPRSATVPDPTAVTAVTTAPATGAAVSNHWRTATLAVLCGWLLTIIVMRRRHNKPQASQTERSDNTSEAAAFKQLLAACGRNEAAASRQLLQDWLRLLRPDLKQPGLSWLQQQGGDSDLAEQLAQLDDSMYSAATSAWQGRELARTLKRWRKAQKPRRGAAAEDPLPPLYQ